MSENGVVITENRKARFNYSLFDTFEAGLVLSGSEVKSLRQNGCSIAESFVGEMNSSNELFLFNANIPVYEEARIFGHEPKSPRKILLHKKEMNKLLGAVRKKGMTIVPLALFFNSRGIAKLRIALACGKNVTDKRATIKERDWNRNKAKILKIYNKTQ